jgi:purine-binding chemotaxis protein CheW
MASLHEMRDAPVGVSVVETTTANQFVTFTAGDRAFGIDIMSVREIRSWSPTTELPSQPFGAIGVLDIRGSIVQVYDLQRMLGSHGGSGEAGQVVLVVSLRHVDVGLLVNTVSDIIFAQGDDLRPLPGVKSKQASGGQVAFLVKNEDRLIAILDLAALFPSEMDLEH